MKSWLLILLLVLPGFAAKRCDGCSRDAHGRIKRNPAVVRKFRATVPCPATGKIQKSCRGYVVDHVLALECGGPDAIENLQFQTIADGRAKDRAERECRK